MLLYRALFAVHAGFRAAWWGVFAFTWIFACSLSTLWLCGHPSGIFDTVACASREAAINGRNAIIVGCVFNVTSDFAVMALPLAMLRTLRISRAQKVGLAGVFLVAGVDVALDIARTIGTFAATVNVALNVLEPTIAVIVCALPVYRNFVKGLAGSGVAAERWWSAGRSWWSRSSWLSSLRSRSGGSKGGTSQESGRAIWVEKDQECYSESQTSRGKSRDGPWLPPLVLTKPSWLLTGPTATELGAVDEPLNYGIRYYANATGPRENV